MAGERTGARTDDRGPFEREVLPHADRLFRQAFWLVRDRTEAEDLVRETTGRALASFSRFRLRTNCRAWLITLLQRVRSGRSRGREPVVADPDDRVSCAVPSVPPIPPDLTDEQLLAALRRIPAQCQEVILLCDVQELTYKSIALSLGVPIRTVISRLRRGRDLLRTELVCH